MTAETFLQKGFWPPEPKLKVNRGLLVVIFTYFFYNAILVEIDNSFFVGTMTIKPDQVSVFSAHPAKGR